MLNINRLSTLFTVFSVSASMLMSCSTKEQPAAQTVSLLVGGYTDDVGDGIYKIQFNPETGELTQKETWATTLSPSYISYNNDKSLVYAVNEEGEGSVSIFKVGASAGELLNQYETNGAAPCHIALNEANDQLVVSNYMGGNYTVFNLDESGLPIDEPVTVQHSGSGRHQRQEASHLHFGTYSPDQKLIYTVDLGTDKIMALPVTTGANAAEITALELDSADGPRHLVFDKNGEYVFILNELSNTLVSAKVVADSGTLQLVDRKSTLPDDFAEYSQAAAIKLSQDGKYVYVSNRGHNSIAVFEAATDGTLTFKSNHSIIGDWPRDFTFSPDGNYLLVANERSNKVNVFAVDINSGALSETPFSVEVSKPTCLIF
jgi:6-phosphogluconolactonase